MPTSERAAPALGAALLLAIALGGCHPSDRDASTPPTAEASGTAPLARIPCAAPGGTALARTCTVGREQTSAGQVLTLRRADGGFRRLTITTDGRGVIASDGAQSAAVAITGPNEIEVAVAGERYRLPATVKATR